MATAKGLPGPAEHRMQRQEYEAAFTQHFDRIHSLISGLVGDAAEAEDLTLEAFWRLWQASGVEDGRTAAWLYRVATRLGYNALRARARRTAYELAAVTDGALNMPAEDPAAAAERQLRAERVRAALLQLEPRQAQLLGLRMIDLTYREIAEALQIKPGSVGTMLARAEAEFEAAYRALDAGPEAEATAEGGSHAPTR
jgi:RNA polymerase sigma-70 factor, ECF subfamily